MILPKGVGVASVTVDPDGKPLTNPSSYTTILVMSIRIQLNVEINAVLNHIIKAVKKLYGQESQLYMNAMLVLLILQHQSY